MSDAISRKISECLQDWPVPGCGRNLLDGGGMLSACELGDDGLRVQLQLAFPAADIADTLQQQLVAKLKSLIETETVQLELQWKIGRARTQGKLRSLPEVGNIIAVGSAKGGVGKSTVAVNIALALRSQGARVGILDADIHGPSQQLMLGVAPEQRPQTVAPNSIIPMEAHGIQSISMGFLLGEKQPLVWRGPMVSGALQQLLGQTLWKELDYLIIDMPPGTGDIQLTLAQKVPVSGAVIVTTPQQVALADARRTVAMFRKVEVGVLGIVENMSSYLCPHCGAEELLFDSGGGKSLAAEVGVPLLGSMPLDIGIRRLADEGRPIVVAQPESTVAERFRSIARSIALELALRPAEQPGLLNVVDITDAMSNSRKKGGQ